MNAKKKIEQDPLLLDEEEKDLLNSFEKGEWRPAKNAIKELAEAKNAATNYFRKNARINIRISENDLAKLKQKAAFEGIPYQTFIASILHKYAAGHK
jgi:predicted DNA binding CopG/RHH family protein